VLAGSSADVDRPQAGRYKPFSADAEKFCTASASIHRAPA